MDSLKASSSIVTLPLRPPAMASFSLPMATELAQPMDLSDRSTTTASLAASPSAAAASALDRDRAADAAAATAGDSDVDRPGVDEQRNSPVRSESSSSSPSRDAVSDAAAVSLSGTVAGGPPSEPVTSQNQVCRRPFDP